MAIGFIGLGLLGTAIAKRLAVTGEEVVAWNRTPGKAERAGLATAGSVSAVAQHANVIFLCLFDSAAVREVLCGSGLLVAARPGTLVIDTTTNDYRVVGEFHEACGRRGVMYLEAPVLGSVGPASQGKLTALASGSDEAFAAAKPYLEKIAEKIFHFGEPGMATRMKLVNNLVLGAYMATISEAVALGERCGMTREQVIDVLAAGAGNSMVLTAKRGKLLQEDFTPQFAARTIDKDLRLVEELAAETGATAGSSDMTRRLLARVIGAGKGDEDFSSMYKAAKGTL